MMDDDGNNGEDDGDIMIAIDEDEDDLLLQLHRYNFLDAAKFPPRETTTAATMAT